MCEDISNMICHAILISLVIETAHSSNIWYLPRHEAGKVDFNFGSSVKTTGKRKNSKWCPGIPTKTFLKCRKFPRCKRGPYSKYCEFASTTPSKLEIFTGLRQYDILYVRKSKSYSYSKHGIRPYWILFVSCKQFPSSFIPRQRPEILSFMSTVGRVFLLLW